MAKPTLESLIEEHKERIKTLKLKEFPPNCIGFDYYYYRDNDAYQLWLAKTKRFIGIEYLGDKDVAEFDRISKEELGPHQQQELLAILEAFAALPTIIPVDVPKKRSKSKGDVNINITNSNSQSQNQQMSIAVELFLEAIKDELKGKQQKELKAIIEEANGDMEKARPSIIEKLKSFGLDVTSNILANIITNPAIYEGFLGLF